MFWGANSRGLAGLVLSPYLESDEKNNNPGQVAGMLASEHDKHFIPGLGVAQYVNGAARLGIPVNDLLDQLGLDPAAVVQPMEPLPQQDLENIILACAMHSGDELFGFHVGNQVMLAAYGMLMSLALGSPTLRDALELCFRYQALAGGNIHRFRIEENRQGMLAVFETTHTNGAVKRHVTDNIFALVLNIGRMILGDRGVEPVRVALAHRSVTDDMKRVYEQHYRCPVEYGVAHSTMLVGHELLSRPLNLHDTGQLALAEEQARQQLAQQQQERDWLSSVRDHVLLLMEQGAARRELVADRLNISVRTLDRRLQELGVSWQQLLDGVRTRMARELITDPSMTVQAVATRLGFSDVRSFQRRFRHWTGMSPSDYRDSQGSNSLR